MGTDLTHVSDAVNKTKDHPAILMWALGNEWNYNGHYIALSFEESLQLVNDAAERIKSLDTNHPIATIYGHLPSKNTVDRMPNIDIWGLNVYSGDTFGNLFTEWKTISTKPMFMSEYGADAWNANINNVDVVSQAFATKKLTQEIMDNSSVNNATNVSVGGTIFEWNDEWWKDPNGSWDVQDVGGIAPGGGPYPDATFNEEYWGIVDINRNPRDAYYELKALYTDND